MSADLSLPEDAIKAACQRWLDREWPDGALTGTEYDIDHLAGAFRAGWAAAAPVLRAQGAAAEREREFVLVWRDERGDEICRSTPLRPGTTRIAIPIAAFCADHLLGGAVGDGEPPGHPGQAPTPPEHPEASTGDPGDAQEDT